MYNKIPSLIILTLALLISNVKAQTIVNYYDWNPTNPACNILVNAIDINGVQHQSQIGQTYYSSTTRSLRMDCRFVNSSSYLGMKYRIAYNFKQGYRYQIKVNANVNVHVNGVDEDPRLRLDLNNNSGGGAGIVCSGPQSINPDFSGNPPAQKVDDVAFKDYIYSFDAMASNSSTLQVSCIPYAGVGTKTIGINKITITETPPPVSFTLSQSLPAISCGSTNPITFTVTNGGNTPGITGYTWNLGSANNGWLYNGSAAPATILTGATVNTITLTPACGSALSNVSATVTANLVNYNTNADSVAITAPNAAIEGSPNACTAENYFISGLPCNATVSWGITPATGIASIFPLTGPSTTVTKVGNGNITLTATIQSSCGVFSLIKQIVVGTPQPSIYFENAEPLCINMRGPTGVKKVTISNPSPGVIYRWKVNGTIRGTNTWVLNIIYSWGISGTNSVSVEAFSCGNWVSSGVLFFEGEYCETNNGKISNFVVSPNPSSENISVSVNNSGSNISNEIEVQEVELIDKMGSNRYKRKLGKGLTSVNISVSNLPSDIYTLRIFDGEVWHSYKVSIQH